MGFDLNRKTPHDMNHEVLKNDKFTADNPLLVTIFNPSIYIGPISRTRFFRYHPKIKAMLPPILGIFLV